MDATPPQEVRCEPIKGSSALSQADANSARKNIGQALPKTKIVNAKPSSLPGMVMLELEDGKVAYTDRTGRYLLLGVVFDTVAGKALDNQLDGLSD